MKDDTQINAGLLSSKGSPVPLEGVKVSGDIIGRGAMLKLSQSFRNRELTPIEAVYRFPLPEGATICGFKAIVGKKVIEGKIEEREEAFRVYDEALSKGHGAQLLDQERPNIFTLSVGNIKPGESAIIEINYIELLDSQDSAVRFFLPTTISPRYTPANQPDKDGIPVRDLVNPPLLPDVPYGLAIEINIHDREKVSCIESPSHTIGTRFSDKTATVSFSSETTAMDRDFILKISYEKDFANRAFLYRDKDEAFVQVDFTADVAGKSSKAEVTDAGREMIFVLDCSGSMGGESIKEAKRALEIMVRSLNSGTMFNIYLFGSTFSRLYPRSESHNKNTMEAALQYLSEAEASLGGTEVLAPLNDIYEKALKKGFHRDIILITDGEIGNEDQVMDLVRGHADQTNVYTVGIGSGPNEFLVRGVARTSGGSSVMVAPGEKIEPSILKLFGNALAGSIKDIKIEWGVEVKQAPENPVLFQGHHYSIFARLKEPHQEVKSLKISGRTMSGKKEWTVDIQQIQEKNLPMPKMWARERIRDLEEGLGVPTGSRRKERIEGMRAKEIIEISKKYGIISNKTSFVGIEERPKAKRATSEIVLRKVPAMLTTGWGGYAPVPQHTKKSAMLRPLGLETLYCFSDAMEMSGSESRLSIRLKTATDLFLKILSLQRPDGGFNIEEPVGKLLHLSNSDIRRFVSDRSNELRRIVSAELEGLMRTRADEIEKLLIISAEQARVIREIGADQIEEVMRITSRVEYTFKDASAKFDEIKSIAHEIEKLNYTDYSETLETMIVLHLLEIGFAERRSEWEEITMKSRKWIDDRKRTFVPIAVRQMEDWVHEFLEYSLKKG